MNYKKNEAGDVLVRDAKGNPKYISEKLAEDKQLMKSMHFLIVEAPTFCEELKLTATDVISEDVSYDTSVTLEIIEEKPVAETLTAKSKSTKKK